MNSIADVVAGGVPRSWHESVAVVQEVAVQLSPGLSPPDPQDVLFDDDGRLTLGFGSESSDPPVVQLASLLRMLLEGTECPAPLMELAVENSRVPPAHSSMASFVRALAFFERPNRASDIAALAGRLGPRDRVPQRDIATEKITEGNEESVDRDLERLRDKVAHAETPAPRPQGDPRLAAAVHVWARPAAAALLLIAVALAAGAWLQGRGDSPATGISNAVETAETNLADVLSKGLDRYSGVQPAAAPNNETPVEKPARDIHVPARAPASRSRSPLTPPPGRDSSSAKPGGTPRAVGSSGLPSLELGPDTEIVPSSPVVPALDLTRVYTNADAGIEPPRLRRPQLPTQPDPDATTGYFDIIVNELGQVDEVRLISPSRRYYDRMMVAAAKAWMFQPARLNGRPVKYRTRIPIIGPPPM